MSTTTISTLAPVDTLWAVEIGAPVSTGDARPAPQSLVGLGTMPVAAGRLPTIATVAASPIVRVADRPWTTEPTDATLPNTLWSARLTEAPAIEKSIPIYPSQGSRLSREAGEVVLLNQDGSLNDLAGDWTLAGRPVVLLRAPFRRPRHAAYAEAVRVAELRAAGAFFGGGGRLRLPLASAGSDLSVPACVTFLGTGGVEGDGTLAGQPKPRLYGFRRNLAPVPVLAASLLFMFHTGAASAVVAARDRGVALTNAGDHANYAALAAAAVAAGTFQTCLAEGLLRTGSTPSFLTIDARGDNEGGVYASSAAAIAERLLRGPGGIDPSRAAAASFSAWATGEVGLWLQGGTVADAMDALAGSIFATWGTDTSGGFLGRALTLPTEAALAAYIEPWMLAAPPEENEAPQPPWARSVVGYRPNGVVQTGEDLAGSVSAADRTTWGRPRATIEAFEAAVRAAYPTAIDGPEVQSAFEAQLDAVALAVRLQAVFGKPRRSWLVRVGANAGRRLWAALEPGAGVRLTWPQQSALATGRDLIVRQVSARGDRVDLVLWG